jgi:predicted alpha-1,2-mannosidase
MKKWLIIWVLLLFGIDASARPLSIADQAKVTASSVYGKRYVPENITDGIIAVENRGYWKSKERNAWIQLDWKTPQWITKVVIYNLPEEKNRVRKGKLLFSDGSSVDVDLPSDGTAKAVEFAEKQAIYVRFEVTEGGETPGLSEIEVFPSPARISEPVSLVDPYIETNRGRFFYFITGSRPFGLVSAAPMTINGNNGGGGYAHKSTEILGFPQIHSWTISGISLMPALANINPALGEKHWKSMFKHDDEIVQPGYHRVYLPEYHTWVEQTSTDRVGLYRFTWTKDTVAQILLNLGGPLGNSRMAGAEVKKISDTEYQGSVSSVDRAYMVGPVDVKLFFVVQFDKPCSEFNGWEEEQYLRNISSVTSDSLGGVATIYKVKAGERMNMKIAISYTSIENAGRNLAAECPGWDFDKAVSGSRKIWNEWLGKIEVEGGSCEQRIKFYTDLWHVLLGRQKINDVSGDYPDRTEGPRSGEHGYLTDAVFKIKNTKRHNMFNSDAFWLTQWNLNVLWGLAWPGVQDDMASSMVEYSVNGGLLPRGPAGGGYTFIMTGCPSTNLIVSTFMKNILTRTDHETAYRQIRNNHHPGGMMGGSKYFAADLKFYIEKGWWPNNAGINIEAAFQDWAAAQMAKKLGKADDYEYFMKRSDTWKRCYEPNHKLLFPVNHEGKFTHTDPLEGWGYVEANAWQATWGVSHDIPGLAALMGGNSELCRKLNEAFEQGKKSDFVYSYSKGYVSYANQPGCSNAHVFSYAGAPFLTQYWVRKVKEQAYGGITPDLGYGGHDEDQGQMGGVSALMAIGLFSITGTESMIPYYEITSPVFDKITLKLDNKYYKGEKFVIKTHNNSAENCYIQKATLNGRPLNNFWFTHEEFAKGGELELWLGSKPNREWGTKTLPPVNPALIHKNRLKVASYNIRYDTPGDGINRWSNRKDAVKALIRYHDIDIAGTQEGLYPMLQELCESSGYAYFGAGLQDGRQGGQYSAILYKKDKFSVLDSGNFWLSETPEKPSKGWDAGFNRVCSWIKFREKNTSREFYFFNVHFDHQGHVARREAGKLMVQKMKEIAKDYPVICTGDFNSTPETEQIRMISAFLSDARNITVDPPYGPEGTFTNRFTNPVGRDRIDYIFVGNQFGVNKYAVLTDYREFPYYPSDHLPVVAELSY